MAQTTILSQFLMLLMLCSLLTSLMVEATKKMLGSKKVSYNLVAAIESIVVAGAISVGYLVYYEVSVTPKNIVSIVALIVMSWMCAMLGYDKVKQTLLQIKGEIK